MIITSNNAKLLSKHERHNHQNIRANNYDQPNNTKYPLLHFLALSILHSPQDYIPIQ